MQCSTLGALPKTWSIRHGVQSVFIVVSGGYEVSLLVRFAQSVKWRNCQMHRIALLIENYLG